MSKRKIEFLEAVRLGDDQFEPGDSLSFDKALAGQYISMGWAKCAETGETGDRVPGAQPIQVQPVVQQAN